jgi:6-phosphogluconate dehydrogenase
MQRGLVGVGKTGFNMTERLGEGGHEVIGYEPRPVNRVSESG